MSKYVADSIPEMTDDLERWHQFSAPLEGRVYSMYLDIKGLVTCAVGILIDPVSMAVDLPWRVVEGAGYGPAPDDAPLASKDEIRAAWSELKRDRKNLAKLHWKYAARRNNLRLSEADVDEIVKRKLFTFERYMSDWHFPYWREFPADAQLAICSMAWACGPGFPKTFKNFTRFANRMDWPNAAKCAKIREAGNPGIVPRNRENQLCFRNAAIVAANDMDPDTLHWPKLAEPPKAEVVIPPAPTVPDEEAPELLPLEVPWQEIGSERDAIVRGD